MFLSDQIYPCDSFNHLMTIQFFITLTVITIVIKRFEILLRTFSGTTQKETDVTFCDLF